jgi:2-dehydropantoate 2-reductase
MAQHGHDVVVIARGPHAAAIESSGLAVESPDDRVVVKLPVARTPAEVDWRPSDGDVVLLGMKSHDTGPALLALRDMAGPTLPVVCLQNGVENERAALRLFERVYGVCVMLPGAHLEPGVVQAFSAPTTGLLDVGRYPTGVDDTAAALAEAFTRSTFPSEPRPDVMRWKYAKLLLNLGNAIEALCGPDAWRTDAYARVRAEGEAVLRAAGVDFASEAEDRERRGDHIRMRPVGGERRGGGSSWQSLARGTGSIETDYLNGEIVLLGRLHGVPTPLNQRLQEAARSAAAAKRPPGSMSVEELLGVD